MRWLIVLGTVLFCGCRVEKSIPPLPDAGAVCHFESAGGALHVITRHHHWTWRGEGWRRQQRVVAVCHDVTHRLWPSSARVAWDAGRLQFDGHIHEAQSLDPTWIDGVVRVPSPYFSRQRAYYPYPIEIFGLSADGQLWRGEVTHDQRWVPPQRLVQLPPGAQPLRLALHDGRLLVLFRWQGALHVGVWDSAGLVDGMSR